MATLRYSGCNCYFQWALNRKCLKIVMNESLCFSKEIFDHSKEIQEQATKSYWKVNSCASLQVIQKRFRCLTKKRGFYTLWSKYFSVIRNICFHVNKAYFSLFFTICWYPMAVINNIKNKWLNAISRELQQKSHLSLVTENIVKETLVKIYAISCIFNGFVQPWLALDTMFCDHSTTQKPRHSKLKQWCQLDLFQNQRATLTTCISSRMGFSAKFINEKKPSQAG